MNSNEATPEELVNQLSNWGLHYLAGALTETIRSHGSFNEKDLRQVVGAAHAVPTLVKVQHQKPTPEPELQHPGTWLPGDQIRDWEGDTWTRRRDDRWTCSAVHCVWSDRDINEHLGRRKNAYAGARIVHLVPRTNGASA